MAEIQVKALIDKEKNRVVFVESDADFVDMLFSFLTMPMGTIIKLNSRQPSKVTLGSMNNLYTSVQSLDVKYFGTRQCKDMLLNPRSGAEAHLRRMRLALEKYDYFLCCNTRCRKRLSYYKNAYCCCGKVLECPKVIFEPAFLGGGNGGVFLKGLTRCLISDDLRIVPLSFEASLSLLSKRVENGSPIEQRTFRVGENEMLNLLKSLLESKMPLTETLLKNSAAEKPNREYFAQGVVTKKRKISSSSGHENITVKLIMCKSWDAVCYAEADEDFVDLLFSFLTIPLGNILKEMHGNCIPFKGCALHLHESAHRLDAAKNLMSDEIKQLLFCPKIAPHFGIKKQLLNIEEDVTKQYYYGADKNHGTILVTDESHINCSMGNIRELALLDPMRSVKKSREGYVEGPAMFIVTGDLVITPISSLSGFSILDKLNVPLDDIEERIVHVGKGEATRLWLASFISKSPLTDVFIRKVPKLEC